MEKHHSDYHNGKNTDQEQRNHLSGESRYSKVSNLKAMASNLNAMASNLNAMMDSNLNAMASDLNAMASNLKTWPPTYK